MNFTIKTSLRLKTVIGILLPLWLISILVLVGNYQVGKNLLEERIMAGVENIGSIVYASIRPGLLKNSTDEIQEDIDHLANSGNIRTIMVLGLDNQVVFSSLHQNGAVLSKSDSGCQECHSNPEPLIASVTYIDRQSNLLRIAKPIPNEPECQECHLQSNRLLGVLLVDNATADIRNYLNKELFFSTIFYMTGLLIVGISAFYFTQFVIVRRIEFLKDRFTGDKKDLIELEPDTNKFNLIDEISDLNAAYNLLIQQLGEREEQIRRFTQIKEKAIIDEREHIARELHDDIAQLLGYVNNKTSSIRILLSNNQYENAIKNLGQLENAVQDVFIDLREAILGLRLSGQIENDFLSGIKAYLEQFSFISGIPTNFKIKSGFSLETFELSSRLQVFRIIQESLHNIRKHSEATQVEVIIEEPQESKYKISIQDNGKGFLTESEQTWKNAHYGLIGMQERAHIIGGELEIVSRIGNGTVITLTFAKKV